MSIRSCWPTTTASSATDCARCWPPRPDLEVVAEAEDGLEALELCRGAVARTSRCWTSPCPASTASRSRGGWPRRLPEVKSIILSMHSDRRFVLEALRAGAAGYLLKDAGIRELIDAVRAVCDGPASTCAPRSASR